MVVKNEISHNDYINTMKTNNQVKKNVIALRSFDHQIYTIKNEKIALNSFYDKMIMNNSIDCVPYGSKQEHDNTSSIKQYIVDNADDLSPMENMMLDEFINHLDKKHKIHCKN